MSLSLKILDEGRLLEAGEHKLHHNAPPMPPNDSGNIKVGIKYKHICVLVVLFIKFKR